MQQVNAKYKVQNAKLAENMRSSVADTIKLYQIV
jgi:hypothetical protein